MWNHYVIMTAIMILAGLFSTMNVWADKWADVRLSLNDVYMITLMTGWMLFFMGLVYRDRVPTAVGAITVCVSLVCIRTQAFITETQYLTGMIPHHSMAVHMSKRLLEKDTNIRPFLTNLIQTQEEEILFMSNRGA